MAWILNLKRFCLLLFTLCAIILLGVSAHYANTTLHTTLIDVDTDVVIWPQSAPDPFTSLNIAASAFVIATVPGMIGIDALTTGAFTSTVLFELVWLSMLWVLWIAAIALTGTVLPAFNTLCADNPKISNLQSACKDNRTATGVECLGLLAVTVYVVCLLSKSIAAPKRGRRVWTATVRQVFGGPLPSPIVNPQLVNLNAGIPAQSAVYDGSKPHGIMYEQSMAPAPTFAVTSIPPSQMANTQHAYPPPPKPQGGYAQEFYGGHDPAKYHAV